MNHKRYHKFFIITLLFLWLVVGIVQETTVQAQTVSQLKLLIPLYIDPPGSNDEWGNVAEAASNVPITVIVNPNNGPDGCPLDNNYVDGINRLHDAGITILGYVYTEWGTRDMQNVKADIDLYDQCFNIEGIFLDQTATGTNKLNYYRELYRYVKEESLNLDKVVLNPGTNIHEDYLTVGDTIGIFGDYSNNWPGYQPDDYVYTYPAERFAIFVYAVPDADTMEAYIGLAVDRNIGYVYLTNDIIPNPWDTLPSFFDSLLATLTPIPPGPPDDPPTPTNPIPEPATLFLFGAGLVGVLVFAKKKLNMRK